MGRRLKAALLFSAAAVFIGCGSPLKDVITDMVKEYSTPTTLAYYSGVSLESNTFTTGAGLAADSVIIINFSETMNTASLVLGGNSAEECDGGIWSTNTNENDTLTISPSTAWTAGSGRTLTIDCSDLEDYPAEQLSVTFGVLEGIVYVHEINGNADNPGTSDLPKADVGNAVTLAAYLWNTADVYVAEGVYQSATPVKISKAISLTGGFSPEDWNIRETDPYWPTTGDLESSYPTVLKSLYTSTGASGEEPYVIYCSGFTGDLTISGFNIIGGVGEGSTAMLINECSPTLRSNVIDGGKGELSFGIGTLYSSSLIEYNRITGGDFELSTGVYNYLSTVTLSENIITGGSGGQTTGIYNIDSPTIITRNDISAGSARDSTEAIAMESSSDCIIRNNKINAGSASSTIGIRIKTSDPIIQNNIINGGGASILADSMAEGMWFYNASSPVIENNIIYLTSGTLQYGLSQGDSTSTPLSVKNNNFFNKSGSAAYICYINVDTESEYDTATDLNALSFATSNTSADPDINWDSDLNFTATSPIEVTEGGLDLSAYFTVDFSGTTRTSPWSMGAFEKD